jgi:hypothetical protein
MLRGVGGEGRKEARGTMLITGGEVKPRKELEIETGGGKHKSFDIRWVTSIDEPVHHRPNGLAADLANSPAGRERFAGRKREGPSGRTGTLSSGPSPKGHRCNPQ